MNRHSMRCALSLISRSHRPIQSEADAVYGLGQRLMSDSGQVTFPMFLMLADIYRSFNSMVMDSSVISESQLRRGLAEQNYPNRFSDSAVKEIYRTNGGKPMDFKTFCVGMYYYQRFKVYADVVKGR